MSQYDEHEEIIADDLRFKSRLGIGEEEYNYLKRKKNLADFVGAIGVGGAAVGVASSSTVATTFFPASGFLAMLGFGAAATTPIGWVIGAGVLVGGAYLGASKLLGAGKDEKFTRVPKHINTPLDLIADELLGFMLPLSLRIAISDGQIIKSEIDAIVDHYVKDWGYSRVFVDMAIRETENNIGSMSYERLSESLSKYCGKNPDCNQKAIVEFLLGHLEEVTEAGGDSARKKEGLGELRKAFSKIR